MRKIITITKKTIIMTILITSKTGKLDLRVNLYEGLKTKPEIQVGIFAAASSRTDGALTNADLGAAHEYGVPEHGLPPRSFLKTPIADHATEIMAPFKGHPEAMLAKSDLMTMWKRIGIAAENVVLGAFKSDGYGKWQPLSYRYLLWKLNHTQYGGKRNRSLNKRKTMILSGAAQAILILTGQLRSAISSRVRMRFT